jgi:hypothetical protein
MIMKDIAPHLYPLELRGLQVKKLPIMNMLVRYPSE